MNANRPILLATLAIALFGLAAYFAFGRRDPASQVPDDAAHAHTLICAQDGHTFTRTPKALRDALENGDASIGNRADRAPLTVRCPQCAQMTGQRAGRCPACDAWRLSDMACPSCNGAPLTPAGDARLHAE